MNSYIKSDDHVRKLFDEDRIGKGQKFIHLGFSEDEMSIIVFKTNNDEETFDDFISCFDEQEIMF